MDEKSLSRVFRAANLSETKRGWRCPTDSDIAAYADHRLEGQERARVETHLADCSFCLSQVAFLAQVAVNPVVEDTPIGLLARARDLQPPKGRFGLAWSLRWGAVAASVASLAIIVSVSFHDPGPPAPTLAKVATAPQAPQKTGLELRHPITNDSIVRQSASKLLAPALIFPRPNAALTPGAVDFRWDGIHEALFYEIKVVSADGDLVWESRADGTSATLPSSLSLQGGRKYFVWVEAVLAEGKTIRSESVAFTVAPNN